MHGTGGNEVTQFIAAMVIWITIMALAFYVHKSNK